LKLRRRTVEATEPEGPPVCKMTADEGRRRQAGLDRLFSHLLAERQTAGGNEFVFQGDREQLWNDVSLFVDEEARCCPFFSYEQIEQMDGVTLRVITPGLSVNGP
jgi:hypothetical protein